jgi:hypothetical protein
MSVHRVEVFLSRQLHYSAYSEDQYLSELVTLGHSVAGLQETRMSGEDVEHTVLESGLCTGSVC